MVLAAAGHEADLYGAQARAASTRGRREESVGTGDGEERLMGQSHVWKVQKSRLKRRRRGEVEQAGVSGPAADRSNRPRQGQRWSRRGTRDGGQACRVDISRRANEEMQWKPAGDDITQLRPPSVATDGPLLEVDHSVS